MPLLAQGLLYLHSTMFLLNLMQRLNLPCIQQNLHSTMFLLNHKPMQRVELFPKDLHSTMFLLNPKYSAIFPNLSSFTFHYVSIKSPVKFFMRSFVPLFTFHYVSIKSRNTKVAYFQILPIYFLSTLNIYILSSCKFFYNNIKYIIISALSISPHFYIIIGRQTNYTQYTITLNYKTCYICLLSPPFLIKPLLLSAFK